MLEDWALGGERNDEQAAAFLPQQGSSEDVMSQWLNLMPRCQKRQQYLERLLERVKVR